MRFLCMKRNALECFFLVSDSKGTCKRAKNKFIRVFPSESTFVALNWAQRYGGMARYAKKSSEPTDFWDLRTGSPANSYHVLQYTRIHENKKRVDVEVDFRATHFKLKCAH